MRGTEYVISESPFIVRRVVRWSDCDPAGVVYTGRFTDYLLGAVSLFNEYLAAGARSLGEAHGVDTPCRGLSLSFEGTLWPRDEIDIRCAVGDIRQRSYDLACTATRPDGTPVFHARFSPICVRRDARVGTDIPASLRAVLSAHATRPSPQGSFS
ncbi:acyl-CoA thioesterase [Verticiella sediminum]|nr:acyl-CoA thioesterase [Verticiella sediminum]